MRVNEKIRLHHQKTGRGTPIIMIHGFGGHSYSWRHLVGPLSQDFSVFTVDLKGFGNSPKPSDSAYSIFDQVELLLDLILDHSLSDVILMGHSYGGAVVLGTAGVMVKQNPSWLRGLVIIGGAAYPQKLPHHMSLLKVPSLGRIGINLISPKAQVRMVLKECFHDPSRITEDMILEYSRVMKMPGNQHAMIQTVKQIIPDDVDNYIASYSQIHVPTLLIWGKEDRMVPVVIAERLKGELPAAELEIITECGHIPQEECPEETLRLIQTYLSTLKN